MRFLFKLAILAAPFLVFSDLAGASETSDRMCANAARHAEDEHRIPRHLLFAISLKETGRWHDERQESYTWPWTVTSGGEGKHFPNKIAAMAEVRRLLAKGTTNIDVGCMQINLHYHGKAFEDLEEAFDPDRNTEYAALFLTELKKRHGSWRDAIEHYHSGNETRGRNYRHAVSRLQQQAYKGVAVTSADPSRDDIELAARSAARADALSADAEARREQHEQEAAIREARAARQLEIASETARQLKQEFENRRASKLAAWRKLKEQRQAAAGFVINVN
ncbi:transglycosylase SLT domain-containing protein [Nisaea sediminum]|uniref:transglycosylase SLT domain-containing protein n=1 Tax=Nisaea sediminum TaxID=2775867 RepID=UPI0018683793|nr:transglycosylase SLT domain-containing protein [Nisaea sediminum]